MSNNYTYLVHHGILGQKWGIRRFQNSDGTLTTEGRKRYRTDRVLNNVGRAFANTTFGQRMAVTLNKGYRTDKKEIKGLYKEKKKEFKQIEDKDSRKEKIKSLKSDFKKTKGEARVSAAQANYGWQTEKANTKIQTQHLGKSYLKAFLMGYGSTTYDNLRAAGTGRGLSGAAGIGTNWLNNAFYFWGGPIDYAVNKKRYNNGESSWMNYEGIEKRNAAKQAEKAAKKTSKKTSK